MLTGILACPTPRKHPALNLYGIYYHLSKHNSIPKVRLQHNEMPVNRPTVVPLTQNLQRQQICKLQKSAALGTDYHATPVQVFKELHLPYSFFFLFVSKNIKNKKKRNEHETQTTQLFNHLHRGLLKCTPNIL